MSVLALFYLLWAIAALVVYSIVLGLALVEIRDHHHDKRSRRELYVAAALFMTAASSLFGVVLGILDAGTLFRLGFSALALGAFLGAGIVILLEYLRRYREGTHGNA